MKRAHTPMRESRRIEHRPGLWPIALPLLRVPLLILVLSFAVFGVLTAPASGQGCAQCLDSTQATPPAVQAAYRHAIFLLGGVGAALFAGGTLLLRRNR